jgi:hypothetical protein
VHFFSSKNIKEIIYMPYPTIRTLRSQPAEMLMDTYATMTTHRFSRDGIPVIIAARNEQDDLPATLIRLAGSSTEIHPIVVENGSRDETAQRALRMGATVLECERSYKMAALQLGVDYLNTHHQLDRPVVFTDADTLPSRHWALDMSKVIGAPEAGHPESVSGSTVIWHGPSPLIDGIRTVHAATKDAKRLVRNERPVGRGHTMAVNFANNSAAINDYMSLDERLFIGEEEAILDIVQTHGGRCRRLLGRRALVITRGDRFETLSDCLGVARQDGQAVRERLYEEYGPVVPYIR